MLEPVKVPLLKTNDELFDSSYKIYWFPKFQVVFGNNPKYRKAMKDRRVDMFEMLYYKFEEHLVDTQTAYAQSCEHRKYLTENVGDGKSYKEIYHIPEVAFIWDADTYVGHYHPLLEKFQEIMDLSFQAGLIGEWKRLAIETRNIHLNLKRTEEEKSNSTILDFKAIAPFFLILAFGFSAALIALLFEIFRQDFVSNLSRGYFERKWSEMWRKDKIMKVKVRPRARRIRVKPAALLNE